MVMMGATCRGESGVRVWFAVSVDGSWVAYSVEGFDSSYFVLAGQSRCGYSFREAYEMVVSGSLGLLGSEFLVDELVVNGWVVDSLDDFLFSNIRTELERGVFFRRWRKARRHGFLFHPEYVFGSRKHLFLWRYWYAPREMKRLYVDRCCSRADGFSVYRCLDVRHNHIPSHAWLDESVSPQSGGLSFDGFDFLRRGIIDDFS